MMKKQDFYFDLPEHLIAQHPLPNRSDSRLLVYNRENQQYIHKQVKSLCEFLEPGDLLVMNDSKVIPARLYGRKSSGGKVELLIERILDDNTFLAHIKASKALKANAIITLDGGYRLTILERKDDLFHCSVEGPVMDLLAEIGHIPLPPYITRSDIESDNTRYQTVYANAAGSVAAPTAGLHFDESLLNALRKKGVHIAYLTLHVGSGTFRPVRVDNILEHTMHSERFLISQEVCDAIHKAKKENHRVIAVGTTALRALESAALDGDLKPCERETAIFIYPGFTFKVCDGLLTNFHLPESTLLMLVAAFIGYESMQALYREAIAEQYRFFSYGDTSLLL